MAFRELTCRIPLHLHPLVVRSIDDGIQAQLNQFLMSFVSRKDGVVLCFHKQRLLENAGVIFFERPWINVKLEAKLLVFTPVIGGTLVGKVTKVAYDHIGLLVHGVFNASIASADNASGLASLYKYNMATDSWDSKALGKDGQPRERIALGAEYSFKLTGLQHSSDFFSLVGAIITPASGKASKSKGQSSSSSNSSSNSNGDAAAASSELDNGLDVRKAKTLETPQAAKLIEEFLTNNTSAALLSEDGAVSLTKPRVPDDTIYQLELIYEALTGSPPPSASITSALRAKKNSSGAAIAFDDDQEGEFGVTQQLWADDVEVKPAAAKKGKDAKKEAKLAKLAKKAQRKALRTAKYLAAKAAAGGEDGAAADDAADDDGGSGSDGDAEDERPAASAAAGDDSESDALVPGTVTPKKRKSIETATPSSQQRPAAAEPASQAKRRKKAAP